MLFFGCGVKWIGIEIILKFSVVVDGINDLFGLDVFLNLLVLLVIVDYGIISVYRVFVEDCVYFDYVFVLWFYVIDVLIMMYLEIFIMVGLGV